MGILLLSHANDITNMIKKRTRGENNGEIRLTALRMRKMRLYTLLIKNDAFEHRSTFFFLKVGVQAMLNTICFHVMHVSTKKRLITSGNSAVSRMIDLMKQEIMSVRNLY